jgi:glucose-6-phosphate isomerase
VSEITRLTIDNNNLFCDAIGENGISNEDIEALSPRLDGLRSKIKGWHNSTTPHFLNLPHTSDLEEIKHLGANFARNFKRTVIFGIGGSSLGGEMLVRTLGHPHPRNRVTFYDNVDPSTLAELNDLDWRETLLLVISKSGNTAETLSQFLTVLPRMERWLGEDRVKEHTLFITENKDGALYELAKRLNIPVVEHPPVGGRFSVLSVVGLLPAYIAGVDIDGLMEGARAMAKRCTLDGMIENPSFFNGATQYLHGQKGRSITLMMPYSDNMRLIVNWFRQLWAESLGKVDPNGKCVGLTPMEAHGVTDQHSVLQLLLDGPDDKVITFMTDPAQRYEGLRIPMRFQDIPAIAPLSGHTIGELFISEMKASRTSHTNRKRPNRTFAMLDRDAYALGELIILLEMETTVVGELLGIDPFDQPAVEESKILTRQYLAELQSLNLEI